MKKLELTWKILASVFVPHLLLTSCSGGGDDDEIIEEDTTEEVVTISNFTTSIQENPGSELELGTIIASTTKGTVTFSIISQEPAGALAIHNSIGKLTVADSSAFDFEKRTTVTAQVEATNGTKTAIGTVSISITDFVAPQSNLIAAYSFDAGNADDEVGSNDGTVSGATLTSDRFGKDNKAYAFAGNGYIDFGNDATFEFSEDFSISFWLKPSGEFQNAPVLYKRDNGNANYIQYNFSFIDSPYSGGATKYLKVFMRDDNSFDRLLSTQTELSSNWYHVALTTTSEGSQLFLNGVFQAEAAGSGTFIISGEPLRVGGNPDSGIYLNGDMDNIFVYNRVLSTSEISLLSKE